MPERFAKILDTLTPSEHRMLDHLLGRYCGLVATARGDLLASLSTLIAGHDHGPRITSEIAIGAILSDVRTEGAMER